MLWIVLCIVMPISGNLDARMVQDLQHDCSNVSPIPINFIYQTERFSLLFHILWFLEVPMTMRNFPQQSTSWSNVLYIKFFVVSVWNSVLFLYVATVILYFSYYSNGIWHQNKVCLYYSNAHLCFSKMPVYSLVRSFIIYQCYEAVNVVWNFYRYMHLVCLNSSEVW